MAPPAGPSGRPARRRFLRGSLALVAAWATTPAASGTPDASRGLAPSAGSAGAAGDGEPGLLRREALAFGSRVSVTVAGLPRAQAEAAVLAALARIHEVERALDLHDPASPLARLNREGRIEAPPPELARALDAALDWARRSGGAFDPSVQPLWQLHFAAWARGRRATRAQLRALLPAVGWQGIAPGPDGIRLAPGMRCTLNGLAQGLASDEAWALLRTLGVRHALVDAGEPRAAGLGASGRPWRLGLRDPLQPAALPALLDAIELQDAALASSGIDGFSFTPDRRLFHILDPRSGLSPGELAGATVLAADACSADALSTACMVLGAERGLELVASAGAQALLLTRRGRVLRSEGWPRS